MTSLAPFVIALSTVIAQDPAPDAFQSFGNFMVGGVWTRTDDDGNQLEHVYRWTLNKKFVRGTSRKDPTPFSNMFGIDPKTGKMTSWGFNGKGGVGGGTWEKTGPNEWTAKGFTRDKETDLKGTWVLTKVSKDELKVKAELVINGEQVTRESTWNRCVDQAKDNDG